MSQYAAVLLGVVAVMFFFLDFAFKLLNVDSENKTHHALSLFLILSSVVMAWLTLGVAIGISEDTGMSTAVTSSLSVGYFASLAIGTVVIGYFLIWLIVGPAKSAIARKKLEL